MRLFLPNQLKDYYRFFQVPARRWWVGIVGVVFTAALYLGYLLLLSSQIQRVMRLVEAVEWKAPIGHIANNLIFGGLIGLSVLVSWILFRQGFGWLSSVVGKFRWKWFAVAVAVSGIGFFVYNICQTMFFTSAEELNGLAVRPYTFFMIVAILLTTPLQAAGEEFLFRGILGRLIAASIPFRRVGLALSALVPSLIFMLLHTDKHLINNVFYISLGLISWWMAYRTGGIEASVALHASLNVFAQLVQMPFLDLAALPARSDGGAAVFVPLIIALLAMTLVLDWLARRRGLVQMSSPAAAAPEIVKTSKMVTNTALSSEPATKKDLPRLESTIREAVVDDPK